MKNLGEQKLEFVAKTFTDIGKTVFVVALASSFFEKFYLGGRITITLVNIGFIVVGIVIFPSQGESKWISTSR